MQTYQKKEFNRQVIDSIQQIYSQSIHNLDFDKDGNNEFFIHSNSGNWILVGRFSTTGVEVLHLEKFSGKNVQYLVDQSGKHSKVLFNSRSENVAVVFDEQSNLFFSENKLQQFSRPNNEPVYIGEIDSLSVEKQMGLLSNAQEIVDSFFQPGAKFKQLRSGSHTFSEAEKKNVLSAILTYQNNNENIGFVEGDGAYFSGHYSPLNLNGDDAFLFEHGRGSAVYGKFAPEGIEILNHIENIPTSAKFLIQTINGYDQLLINSKESNIFQIYIPEANLVVDTLNIKVRSKNLQKISDTDKNITFSTLSKDEKIELLEAVKAKFGDFNRKVERLPTKQRQLTPKQRVLIRESLYQFQRDNVLPWRVDNFTTTAYIEADFNFDGANEIYAYLQGGLIKDGLALIGRFSGDKFEVSFWAHLNEILLSPGVTP